MTANSLPEWARRSGSQNKGLIVVRIAYVVLLVAAGLARGDGLAYLFQLIGLLVLWLLLYTGGSG